MIAVVVSRADVASEHIGEHLLDLRDWTIHDDSTRPDEAGGGQYYRTDEFELREFDALHLDVERAADAFDDPDLLVFVSRHSGETGRLLTAHHTGNFGPAEYGGEDGVLARACPSAHANLLAAFDRHAPDGYDVGMECTHHGPSEVGVPSMFAELGSGEEQWNDADAARAVAKAVLALADAAPDRARQLVGFGGGHYAPRFTRIVRETDWAVGHVAADWNIDEMGGATPEIVEQAFEESDAEYAVFDGEYPELEAVVENLGYDVVNETWVREVDGVPLALAFDLEEALTPVDEGLRFGAPVEDADQFEVVDLPAELLADAHGVDADRTRDAVSAHALAFETAESASRVAGRAAVEDADAYDRLVGALADVLREKYDRVERRDDVIVAHETAFDPEKAANLGVAEGPAFGRLANGEAVTVEGREIDPAAVLTDRTHEFPV